MKRLMVLVCALALGAAKVMAGVRSGDAAPDFAATDSEGKSQKLADYKGKYVVLEWTNPGCPFVKRQYESHAMQDAQKAAEAKGAVWFTVGTGHAGTDWKKRIADTGATPTAVLPDGDGSVAKAFGAKTTPHVFVIGPDGKVIYEGAIDDDGENPKGAKNYVLAAIEESQGGKAVTKADTKPYGCGVHY